MEFTQQVPLSQRWELQEKMFNVFREFSTDNRARSLNSWVRAALPDYITVDPAFRQMCLAEYHGATLDHQKGVLQALYWGSWLSKRFPPSNLMLHCWTLPSTFVCLQWGLFLHYFSKISICLSTLAQLLFPLCSASALIIYEKQAQVQTFALEMLVLPTSAFAVETDIANYNGE